MVSFHWIIQDGVYVSQLKRRSASWGSSSWILLYFIESVSQMNWYVWFVLIAGHVFCVRSWLITMCDIWPVVGISFIMNVTCGTRPYIPSSAFLSNSSFNLVRVAHTLVFFCSLAIFDLCPLSFSVLVLVTQMLSFEFPYTYCLLNYHCI